MEERVLAHLSRGHGGVHAREVGELFESFDRASPRRDDSLFEVGGKACRVPGLRVDLVLARLRLFLYIYDKLRVWTPLFI